MALSGRTLLIVGTLAVVAGVLIGRLFFQRTVVQVVPSEQEVRDRVRIEQMQREILALRADSAILADNSVRLTFQIDSIKSHVKPQIIYRELADRWADSSARAAMDELVRPPVQLWARAANARR